MDRRYEAVFFDLYGTLVDGFGQALPGAERLLKNLQGAKWAIVTSCSREFARQLITSAKLPVPEVIVSADDVARSKPAPDCYRRAAERLDVDPKRVLVLEDSMLGFEAARSAGMDAVLVHRPESLNAVDIAKENGALILRAPQPNNFGRT